MKKALLYLFAVIGIISLISFISRGVTFYKSEKLIREYMRNCEKVEIGMTLEQALEVIGDLQYQYWTNYENAGGIIVHTHERSVEYTLEYPMTFASSDNMRLTFDPLTLRVTDKFCGE